MTHPLAGLSDVEILARTLYGEARGEPLLGKVAVANVVLNRFRDPGWWTREWGDGILDDTIAAACLDPWQFSCWNERDPNREKLISMSAYHVSFYECRGVAGVAAENLLVDPTNGADHYHAEHVRASWAEGREPTLVVGRHLFYKIGKSG